MNRSEELQCIQKAKASPAGFAPLYNHYFEAIFRFVQRKVGSLDDAGDITSLAFMKAMANIKKYEDRGFPFSSWLYRIASNEVIMHFRKKKKDQVIQLDMVKVNTLVHELDNSSEKERLINQLTAALQNMPEEVQVLIEYRFFDLLSFKEIGGILNIN
ncbi:MAG: RNA polymerase sigma factor, partial [Flavobacteriales bacterium]